MSEPEKKKAKSDGDTDDGETETLPHREPPILETVLPSVPRGPGDVGEEAVFTVESVVPQHTRPTQETVLPSVPRGSGEVGEQATFTTNMFNLKATKRMKIYMYRIDLAAVSEKKERVLTRGPRQDLPSLDRRRVCFSIFYDFVKAQKFGDIGNKYSTVYDCGNYLYSKVEIADGERILDMSEISSSNSKNYLGKHTIKVKAGIKAVSSFDLDESSNSEEVKQFLEVLASACITREGTHLVYSNKMYNRSSDPQVEAKIVDARVLKNGAAKCIRLIGSPDNSNKIALQIDAKKSPFWKEEPVLDMVCEELHSNVHGLERLLESRRTRSKVDSLLKDIFVETTHINPPRTFAISGVHSGNATNTFFERDGAQISVAEYFRDVYNLRLKYPHLPLILERKPQSKSYHPMECLKVPRGQRIITQKSTPLMTQAMIKKCQLTPKFMVDHVLDQKIDFFLNETVEKNKYLQEFGIRIANDPLLATGYQMLPPTIKYKNTDVRPDSSGFLNWKMFNKTYMQATDVKNWLFIIFDLCVSIQDIDNFVRQMKQSGEGHGMRIGLPDVHDVSSEDINHLTREFESAVKSRHKLIMAVTKTKMDDVHDVLKSLEARYGVVTQHVSLEVFTKVVQRNGMVTENLLNKMNPKSGGVNHIVELSRSFQSIHLSSEKRMIIGISLSHAGPQSFADRALAIEQSEPTVIGMTYSMKMIGELSSHYWYQKPRLATVVDIKEHFVTALQYRNSYCGSLPDEIIVFRAGASEGEFAKVKNEMDEIATAFSQFENGAYSPSLTAIVIMRDSNYRLFPERLATHGPPKDQNVSPGSVVDRDITNPKFSEFIMVPHTALQGSCRPIRCTVVTHSRGKRGNLLNLKELEVLTNGLCYLHQASTASTGIPAVLYAAENVAKRGRNNWKYANYCDSDLQSFASGSSGGTHGKWKNDGSPDFFQRLTSELASKAAGMYWA